MNVKSGLWDESTYGGIGEFFPIQRIGFPMNKNLAPDRSGTASQASAPNFRGNIPRRIGNIRSVTLDGRVMNTDQIFGMADAVQESIEAVFGKIERDVQPETGGEFLKAQDNIINAFGKIKSAAKYAAIVLTSVAIFGAGAHAANRNIESVLASQSDLSMFTQALHNTGVADELNENTEYTIFAPTNAAFTSIQPHAYPCFYSAQCRVEVAAILRNHIVPRNESINAFSKWGGDIPTLGKRELYVEETYKDQYTVEGHAVLHQGQGDKVSLYPIDGVIAGREELAQFRLQPVADNAGTVTEKTVTTYRTPVTYSGGYVVPGGAPAANSTVYIGPDELPDNATETKTVTRTTTTN